MTKMSLAAPDTLQWRPAIALTLVGLATVLGLPKLFQMAIDWAYEPSAPLWLASIVSGIPREKALEYPPNLTNRLTVIFGCVIPIVLRPALICRFFERFVGEAGPHVVALMRIYAASILFISAVWEDLSSLALVPAGIFRQQGGMNFVAAIPGFDALLASSSALALLDHTTAAVLLLAAFGVFSRVTVPLGVVLYYVLGGLLRAPFQFYHTGLIPWYLLAVLLFFRSYDVWSFDAWWANRQRSASRPEPSRALRQHYGWARFIGALVVTLPYTEAGLSKMCRGGLFWWEPVNMQSILFMDTLNPMEFDLSVSLAIRSWPEEIFGLLGLFGMVGEIVMVLTLFHRPSRLMLPAMMIAMHVGILFTQNILFFDLILLLTIFYAWMLIDKDPKSPWYAGDWVPKWLPIGPHVDWLHGHRKKAIGSESDGGRTSDAQANSAHVSNDQGQDTQESQDTRKETVEGRQLAETSASLKVLSLGPRLLQVLSVVFVFCWIFGVEFYPLTAMQMYSGKRDTGKVDYYRVLAEYDDGSVEEAFIEHVIPAMRAARYRRAIRECFIPKGRQDCEALLQSAGQHMDRAESIVALEVHHRRWDFRNHPEDEEFGSTVERVRVSM